MKTRYKVQEKIHGKWYDIHNYPEESGYAFDSVGMADAWIKWVHSESPDDRSNYRIVSITPTFLDKVQDVLHLVAMASVALLGFWAFVYAVFSIA